MTGLMAANDHLWMVTLIAGRYPLNPKCLAVTEMDPRMALITEQGALEDEKW